MVSDMKMIAARRLIVFLSVLSVFCLAMSSCSLKELGENKKTTNATYDSDVSICYTITEGDRYDESGNIQLLTSHFIAPTVTFAENKDAEKAINDYFEAEKRAFETEADSLASDSELVLNDLSSDYWDTFFYYVSYSTRMLDDKYLSFSYTKTFYSGSAHPLSEVSGVVFSLADGSIVTLSDIFSSVTDFTSFASEKIAQLALEDEDGEYIFENYTELIPTLIRDGNFILDIDKMTFVCNAYELYPYSAGVKYFDFSYKSIADFLKVSISADKEFLRFYDFDLDGENGDDVLGYISTSSLAKAYSPLATYSVGVDSSPTLSIVPRHIGSTVRVERLRYDEEGEVSESIKIAEFSNTSRDFCLNFSLPLPSGAPEYRITIISGADSAVRASFDIDRSVFAGKNVKRILTEDR